MTWREFIKAVEEKGVKPDDEVTWIDIGPHLPLYVNIHEPDERQIRRVQITNY